MKSGKYKIGGQIILVPQEEIYPNPNQPRKRFDFDELESLAQSIRQNGIIQPIAVRVNSRGEYELISGERRLRASRLVGMAQIPCIIMEASDEKSALFALLENIQRSDLGFFEEAQAIEKLIDDFGMSRDEVCKKLGKAPPTISNKLRLLRLPEDIRLKICQENLTERHARALLRLPAESQMQRAMSIIAEKRLSVAETERLVSQILDNDGRRRQPPVKLFKDVRIFVNTLNHAVDTMRRAGIEADSAKSETDEYIEYIVRIPKNRNCVIKAKRTSA
ncbi:MAG: ParB/RepB/Spo0J family partition protein [Oscillospiraceae bacterium]|nr:ParB/RepB/Spo0J family partition protein [Clostridiaceae bacterium]MDY5947947.1 ParB/RepB/Spo0J family partition protein [Oscillospiraceae bacterium]